MKDNYYNRRPHFHSDTERAIVVEPYDDCCPGPHEQCECVTSADIAAWNQISALSSISGLDNLSALSAFNNISTSANIWNDTYETVSSNSGDWNNISGMSEIINAISAISADIYNNYKEINFDQKTITGDGTINTPYGVSGLESFAKTLVDLNNLITKNGLFRLENGKYVPNWISLTGTDVNPAIEHKFGSIDGTLNELISSDEHQEEVISYLSDAVKSLQKGSGLTVRPIDEDDLINHPEKIAKLTGANTIYVTGPNVSDLT